MSYIEWVIGNHVPPSPFTYPHFEEAPMAQALKCKSSRQKSFIHIHQVSFRTTWYSFIWFLIEYIVTHLNDSLEIDSQITKFPTSRITIVSIKNIDVNKFNEEILKTLSGEQE